MQTVTIDWESYFSTEYSLSRLTTREYIMDPRFEVIGCAIGIDDGPVSFYEPDDLSTVFGSIDWGNSAVLAHNTLFDGAILNWKYGAEPALYLDTMGMAQAVMGPITGSAALKNVAPKFGMKKDVQALLNLKGRRYADIDKSSEEWERYKRYACDDAVQCRTIFNALKPHYPKKELLVIDMLLRMFIDGNMTIDEPVVVEALSTVRAESAQILAAAGITNKSQLRSRDVFADKLKALGVTPPTKISPANGQKTYAFAKNDLEFAQLLEHDDPRVVNLVEAKLNASSTLEESRAERFSRLARVGGGVLNVPLRYSAAHTHRFGGSDKLNLQNLPRKSPLRKAIVAPNGYSIVVVDASQIEARLLAWMAGCTAITSAFARGEDVYSTFASIVFGYPVSKANADERHVGKCGILSLGYGTGHKKLQFSLLTSPFYNGRAEGDFCQQTVDTYRTAYPEIVSFWKHCDNALGWMARGDEHWMDPRGVVHYQTKKILLPSGLFLMYPQLHWADAEEWGDRGYQYYDARYRSWKKMYGAKLTENLIQSLARLIITDTMLNVWAETGHRAKLQVHDEVIYCVPTSDAQGVYDSVMKHMNTVPSWADETLPLAAEGGIAKRYSDAK